MQSTRYHLTILLLTLSVGISITYPQKTLHANFVEVREDFEQGFDTWETYDEPGAFDSPSSWNIVSAGGHKTTLSPQSNIFDVRGKPEVARGTWAIYTETEWENASLEAKMLMTDDDIPGILFRYVDPQNFYIFDLMRQTTDGISAFKRLRKVVDGKYTVLGFVHDNGYTLQQWHTVRIEYRENQIQIFWNNQPLFFADDNEPALRRGKIGLSAWAMRDVFFDDIRVAEPTVEDFAQKISQVSGVITDAAGVALPRVHVHLRQDDSEILHTTTDTNGNYRLSVYPVHQRYRLSASHDGFFTQELNTPLQVGHRRTINFTLRKAGRINGQLLMLDGKTPHVAASVQLVCEGNVIKQTLSDTHGKYQFIGIEPNTYHVRCYTPRLYRYYQSAMQTASEMSSATPLRVEKGQVLEQIDFRFAPFKKGTWKRYKDLGELPNTAVKDIYQTADGTLWLATNGAGVFRYDGARYEQFTTEEGLAHNSVEAILQTSHGVMWFATSDGLSRYDEFTADTSVPLTTLTVEDGLSSNNVRAIYHDLESKSKDEIDELSSVSDNNLSDSSPDFDGTMWIGTARGVSHYDGQTLRPLTARSGQTPRSVTSIVRDTTGNLWVGTEDSGCFRYDGEGFENFTAREGLGHNHVAAIRQSSDGMLWFGTFGGVSRYDGEKFVNFTMENGLPHNKVLAIHQDPEGTLWFGTSAGLTRYDGDGFVNFTQSDGLSSPVVEAIYQDSEGMMWAGTRRGVCRYDAQSLVSYTKRDGLASDIVFTIDGGPKGTMWVGTDRGLSQYDGQQLITLTPKDGLSIQHITAIHSGSDGRIWLGGDGGGIAQYSDEQFVQIAEPGALTSSRVWTIEDDPQGKVWVGTWGTGVFQYDGTHFQPVRNASKFTAKRISSLYRDTRGHMWVGIHEGALARYDGKLWTTYTRRDGLEDLQISAICQTLDGRMWFGTHYGFVSIYDEQSFVTIEREGLVNQHIYTMYHADEGVIWFGTMMRTDQNTGNGVLGYDGAAWVVLNKNDGLAGNAVHDIYQDSDGFLWFATSEGLTRYRRNHTQPRSSILSVNADRLYTYHRLKRQALTLKAGTRVTVRYNGVDYKTRPERRQYRTRITTAEHRESDSEWDEPTQLRTFEWTPNKAGRYRFEVQTIDRDFNYSEPAFLTLKVVPPWYLNGWIILPAGVATLTVMISTIIFGWRYNVQRHRSERLRQEMQEARSIQMGLLPQEPLQLCGFEVAGFSNPLLIGGDFYDYFQSEDSENLLIVVGDAVGHGLPAAIYAQSTSRLLNQIVTAEDFSNPDEILSQLNRLLYNPIRGTTLLTFSMYLAAINLKRQKLRVSRAGDCRGYLIRGGEVLDLSEVKGNDLGALVASQYITKEYSLAVDDLIVLCSDGFINAVGEKSKAVLDFLREIDTSSASTAIESIRQHDILVDSSITEDRADDITVVCVKVP